MYELSFSISAEVFIPVWTKVLQPLLATDSFLTCLLWSDSWIFTESPIQIFLLTSLCDSLFHTELYPAKISQRSPRLSHSVCGLPDGLFFWFSDWGGICMTKDSLKALLQVPLPAIRPALLEKCFLKQRASAQLALGRHSSQSPLFIPLLPALTSP